MTIVPEGTPGAGIVALKRVNELGYYNLSHKDLGERLGLPQYSVTAAIAVLGLKENPDCSNLFKLGSIRVHRYSQKAITEIKALVDAEGEDEVRANYRALLADKRQS